MHASFGNERQKRLAKVLTDSSSFATALFLGTAEFYGPELLEWDPETVLKELEEDFGMKLPQGCFDRLMAARVVVTTDMFTGDLPTFIYICNTLAGSPLGEEFDPASVLEMSWAITEAAYLDLEPGEVLQFSDDIKHYIAATCREEGLLSPPATLAQVLQGIDISTVTSDFSSDPDLYQGVWFNQQTNLLNIEITVQSNLWKLLQQLKELFVNEDLQKKLAATQQEVAALINTLRKKMDNLDAS
jgi:hypothetical protein